MRIPIFPKLVLRRLEFLNGLDVYLLQVEVCWYRYKSTVTTLINADIPRSEILIRLNMNHNEKCFELKL